MRYAKIVLAMAIGVLLPVCGFAFATRMHWMRPLDPIAGYRADAARLDPLVRADPRFADVRVKAGTANFCFVGTVLSEPDFVALRKFARDSGAAHANCCITITSTHTVRQMWGEDGGG